MFEEGELEQESVVRLFRTTAADGKTHQVQHYSLPLVFAVGYRVRSTCGTQFRRWDYFDEILERIRDIRASERCVYLPVKDIFTMTDDYEPGNKESCYA